MTAVDREPAPDWLTDLLLAEHGQSSRVNSREGTVMCLCGEWLTVGTFVDPMMGFPDPEIEDKVRAAHVAAVVWAEFEQRIADNYDPGMGMSYLMKGLFGGSHE